MLKKSKNYVFTPLLQFDPLGSIENFCFLLGSASIAIADTCYHKLPDFPSPVKYTSFD